MAHRRSGYGPARGGYAEDLAHIHDTGYGGFGEDAARCIAAWLHAAGLRDGLVVDLGCGGGQSSRVFADAGYEVLGVDQSPRLIERARARVPGARFEVGSFRGAGFDAETRSSYDGGPPFQPGHAVYAARRS